MAADKISRVVVVFTGDDGSYVERTYYMHSSQSFINASNPQGRTPGFVNVKGPFAKFEDKKGKIDP